MVYNILYKVVLTFESVDKIMKFDYSNESYCAVYYTCAVCMVDEILNGDYSKKMLSRSISKQIE